MRKFLSLLFFFCAAMSSATVFAASSSTPSVEQIDAQTKALEQQITQLKAQVAQLRAAQQTAATPAKTTKVQTKPSSKPSTTAAKTKTKRATTGFKPTQTVPALSADNFDSSPTDDDISETQFANALRGNLSIITSPYLGLRSSYDASDLIINLPSMNEDLVLLQQRQTMMDEAERLGLPFGRRPLIMLSGDLLPQIIFGNDYQGKGVSQATLSGAEIDLQAIAGSWAAGFLALNYDNSTPTATGLNDSSVNNSRVYVSRGFVTVGNLNAFPAYLTTGQMYAPFGNYANSLVTSPLTQALGRALVRAVLLGYVQEGFYAETYFFNGDTYVKNDNVINAGGINAGYKGTSGDWRYDFGAGVISNMADSQGAQNNALSSDVFQGFGGPNGSEQIHRHVPGGNIHTEIRYKNWNLNAEYVGALQSYDNQDMTFNSGGANPQATHLELDYNTSMLNRPWTFVLAYDHSWEALAYNLPQQSYFAVVSVSIWKDTIESIEFRHDENYPGSSTANGSLGTNNGGNYANITPAGDSRNTVTLQLGLYF
ncbi:MAG TPA: LbtU family siderophore porin [Coxiellaceae bacterium]|nr:LbtU family siderophore porin [Coxiellaceae bacterium]